MGCCCGLAGSSDFRWVLHAPSPISLGEFPAGASAPYHFSGTGLTLEFQSGPGGNVTAVNVPGEPPAPPTIPINSRKLLRYWEVRTDMEDGSFLATVTVAYDSLEIPPDVAEEDLAIVRFDGDGEHWVPLPTIVDTALDQVTVTGLTEFSIFIVGDLGDAGVDSHEGTTWGALKSDFR